MNDVKWFWHTIFNIVIGGMAIVVAVISYGKTSPGAIYFYLIGLFTWIFGLAILVIRPDDDIAQLLYLMSVGLLSACSVDATFSVTEPGWYSKFVPLFQFVSSAMLPCVFLRCFAVFPSIKQFGMSKLFRWFVYVPGIILSIVMSLAYLAGNSYERSFFIVSMQPHIILILSLVFVFGYSIAGHGCLLHTWIFGETVAQRKQAKWLFLGIGIGTIPLTLFDTIPSVLGIDFPYGRFSAFTLVLIMVCYGVAMLRHKLIDFELVIRLGWCHQA